ncbi:MAG: hypothetical protein Q9157_001108 [Trypethelium eluteriae]
MENGDGAEVFPVLKKKVALVTGGAQGMGEATASVFLRAGAKVVICDIKFEKGQETAERLAKYGEITFLPCDISKSDEVQNLINQIVEKYGCLDIAINNAAMTPDKTPLTDFDELYWSNIIDVNLTGTAVCCKHELQQMTKQGKGSIVNITSINAFKPQINMPAYTAAKHALLGLTKHGAMEGGPHGVRVNAIAPGAILTEMAAAALVTMGTTHEKIAPVFSYMNRFGLPHEVAQASLWLSSDAASYVTGIGAAIVRNLSSKGCNVVINYLTESSSPLAASLASEVASAHSIRAIPIQADISTPDGCKKLIDVMREDFSPLRIDILVHNAATLYLGPLESVTPEDFHHNYAVNVLGPTLLTAACKPFLPTNRSGRIVILSSINSKIGTPDTTLYSGAKGALEAMTRVWCRELAERATVNAINPGPVMTDMYLSAPEEVKRGLAVWNPVTPLAPVRECDNEEVRKIGERFGGRAAYADEIAGLVASICGEEFGWCTGSMICANGGLSFSL